MGENTNKNMREVVDAVYRAESRRVFATLIRLLGDFDVAEEALHDAFPRRARAVAAEGVPANPRAWLVSAGRFKAIDGMRRRARFDALDDDADRRIIADESAAARTPKNRRRPAAADLHVLPPGAAARRAGRAHAARSVRPDDRRDRARRS